MHEKGFRPADGSLPQAITIATNNSGRGAPMANWRGVFPAVTTQFKADQSLDIPATIAQVERLLRTPLTKPTEPEPKLTESLWKSSLPRFEAEEGPKPSFGRVRASRAGKGTICN